MYFEWMELFEESKKKVVDLKTQIDQTDKEIDRMVYALYGLTEEEIAIVEGPSAALGHQPWLRSGNGSARATA